MGLSTTMSTAVDISDAEFHWATQHAHDVTEGQSPWWPDILAKYGTVNAWHEACAERRAADQNRPLARIVQRLISNSRARPQGALRELDRERLLADPYLAAFWLSVAQAGDDGWREERKRIFDRQQEALRSIDPVERLKALELDAIKALLPVWRAWGQVLIDAGAADELDGAFLL